MKALSLKVKSYKQTKSVADRQMDGRTDRQTTDKVIPEWGTALLAPQKEIKTRQRKGWHPLTGGQKWPWHFTLWPKIKEFLLSTSRTYIYEVWKWSGKSRSPHNVSQAECQSRPWPLTPDTKSRGFPHKWSNAHMRSESSSPTGDQNWVTRLAVQCSTNWASPSSI